MSEIGSPAMMNSEGGARLLTRFINSGLAFLMVPKRLNR